MQEPFGGNNHVNENKQKGNTWRKIRIKPNVLRKLLMETLEGNRRLKETNTCRKHLGKNNGRKHLKESTKKNT